MNSQDEKNNEHKLAQNKLNCSELNSPEPSELSSPEPSELSSPEPLNVKSQEPPKLSLKHLIISTLGAAIGVQSDAVREADFQQKSILPYIIAGVVFTALFLGSLIVIVSLVID